MTTRPRPRQHRVAAFQQGSELSFLQQTFELTLPGTATELRIDPDHDLLIWKPELGPAPDPALEDLRPEPLPANELAPYVGTYGFADMDRKVRVLADEGQLVFYLTGEAPERILRTGGHRFRASQGFLVFEVSGEQAHTLRFVVDGGDCYAATRDESPAEEER